MRIFFLCGGLSVAAPTSQHVLEHLPKAEDLLRAFLKSEGSQAILLLHPSTLDLGIIEAGRGLLPANSDTTPPRPLFCT